MSRQEQIRRSLADFAKKHGPAQSIIATVGSVNEDEFTCDLIDGDDQWFDVRLRPVINGKESITLFPKVGSWVMAIRIESDEEWMLIAADQIEKYRMVVGETIIEYDGVKIHVSNSQTSLKGILDDLITEVIAIYAPKNVAALQALKVKVDQLFK
jgi:hypothetical protein